jgi:hypothetical protein
MILSHMRLQLVCCLQLLHTHAALPAVTAAAQKFELRFLQKFEMVAVPYWLLQQPRQGSIPSQFP